MEKFKTEVNMTKDTLVAIGMSLLVGITSSAVLTLIVLLIAW